MLHRSLASASVVNVGDASEDRAALQVPLVAAKPSGVVGSTTLRAQDIDMCIDAVGNLVKLGNGHFGTVYKALRYEGQPVAVKVNLPHLPPFPPTPPPHTLQLPQPPEFASSAAAIIQSNGAAELLAAPAMWQCSLSRYAFPGKIKAQQPSFAPQAILFTL